MSGLVVDRADLRRAIAFSSLVRAGLVAATAFAVAAGMVTIWALLLVAFTLGSIETVYDNSTRALLPKIVQSDRLVRANGWLGAAETFGEQLAGPLLAGVLFAISFTWAGSAASIGYALSFILALTFPSVAVAREPVPGGSIRSEIAEGLRWVRNDPPILALTVCAGLLALSSGAVTSVLVLYCTESLNLSSRGFGLLIAVSALGGIAGAVGASRLLQAVGQRSLLVASLALVGISFGTLAIVNQAPLAALLLAAGGAGVSVWNTITLSIRQQLVPAHLLGRVLGAYRMAVYGAIPLGAVAGGVVASVFSLRAPFVMAAAIQLGVLARVVRSEGLGGQAVALHT